jgi:hypothetical protein
VAPLGERVASPDEAFEPEDDEVDEPIQAPRPRATPFGSVWDSQLGTPATPAARLGPIADDEEDFDEPEIPEYLIAEQRQGARGRGGRGPVHSGPRGGRAAYQSAVARERYGRGGGGGINRYPDVSGRVAPSRGPRDERGYGRPDDRPRETAPRSSTEPWSEVPPEVEAMLRAQVTQRPPTRPSEVEPATRPEVVGDDGATTTPSEGAPAATSAPKRRTTRTSTAKPTARAAGTAPKRRTTRISTTKASADAVVADDGAATPEATASAEAAPKRRTTRKAATGDAAAADAAPKRRSTRKTAETATDTD